MCLCLGCSRRHADVDNANGDDDDDGDNGGDELGCFEFMTLDDEQCLYCGVWSLV